MSLYNCLKRIDITHLGSSSFFYTADYWINLVIDWINIFECLLALAFLNRTIGRFCLLVAWIIKVNRNFYCITILHLYAPTTFRKQKSPSGCWHSESGLLRYHTFNIYWSFLANLLDFASLDKWHKAKTCPLHSTAKYKEKHYYILNNLYFLNDSWFHWSYLACMLLKRHIDNFSFCLLTAWVTAIYKIFSLTVLYM